MSTTLATRLQHGPTSATFPSIARELPVHGILIWTLSNLGSSVGQVNGPDAVEQHRKRLMSKLNIHDSAGLTRYAIAEGIIESGVRLTIE